MFATASSARPTSPCRRALRTCRTSIVCAAAASRLAFATAPFGPMLSVSGNVAYVRTRILENDNNPTYVGNHWPRVPDWRGNLQATWRPTPSWMASLGVRYSGRMYNRLENDDINPDVYGGVSRFTMVDARVAYTLADGVEVALGVDNLTDERAYQSHPYPGRTGVVEARWSFGECAMNARLLACHRAGCSMADCCRGARAPLGTSAAVDSSGRLWVAYAEAATPRTHVVVARSDDGGALGSGDPCHQQGRACIRRWGESAQARIRSAGRCLCVMDVADVRAIHRRHPLCALARWRSNVVGAGRRASRPADHHAPLRVHGRLAAMDASGLHGSTSAISRWRRRRSATTRARPSITRTQMTAERRGVETSSSPTKAASAAGLRSRPMRRAARSPSGDTCSRAANAITRLQNSIHSAISQRSRARPSIAGASTPVHIRDQDSPSRATERGTRSGSIRSRGRGGRSMASSLAAGPQHVRELPAGASHADIAAVDDLVALAWKRFDGEATRVESWISRDAGRTFTSGPTLTTTAHRISRVW